MEIILNATIITYLFAIVSVPSLYNEMITGCNFLDMISCEITWSQRPRNKSQLSSLPGI